MTGTDLFPAVARGASLAAVLSMFGALAFRLAVTPDVFGAGHSPGFRHAWHRLVATSFAVALVLTLVWLITQSAAIAGADDLWAICTASPTIALRSGFGRLVVARLLLLSTAMLLSRGGGNRRIAAATGCVGCATILQPWLGHAAAMDGIAGAALIAAECLHLLAAGLWLGGLAPLLLAVPHLPAPRAGIAAKRFRHIAVGCVVVLLLSGWLQSSALVGGLPGLLGTRYGRAEIVKLTLVAAVLGLAAAQTWLVSVGPVPKIRWRAAGIATLATVGSMVVVVASGMLAATPPGFHEQPTWPFRLRPSLDALSDPAAAIDTATAASAMLAALILGGGSLFWPRAGLRTRLVGSAAAGLLVVVSVRHGGALFVAAYPTTFYTSPTEFGDSGIVRGARLFSENCVACHGSAGRGDGPDVRELPVAPADLTADHLWAHTDGDLFWWLTNGYPDTTGRLLMPGFGHVLSSDTRWNIIDYLHAHNAGVSMQTVGAWTRPPPMPQFDAICADGRTIDLDDVRGRPLLIVAGESPHYAAPTGLRVIRLARQRSARAIGGACVARERDTWAALAILLGVTEDRLTDAQILVDRDGWLRLRAMPGAPGDWIGNEVALDQALADIEAHPVRTAAAYHHH